MDDIDIKKVIESDLEFWHGYRDLHKQLVKKVDREVQSGAYSAEVCEFAMEIANMVRDDARLWRRYLRSQFGLHVEHENQKWFRKPKTDEDLLRLHKAVIEWQISASMWNFIHGSISEAARTGGDITRALVQAATWVAGELPRFYLHIAATYPHPEVRAMYVILTSSWTLSNISLSVSRNKRLYDVLSEDGGALYEGLVRRMPGSIMLALDQDKPYSALTGPGSFISHICKLLELEGAQDKDHPGPLSAIRFAEHVRLEEFRAREDARRELAAKHLSELTEMARLSQREREVVDAKLDGDLTEEKIAEALGVSRGTIAQVWSRARKKLREAENAYRARAS